ncbi:unnamed protein product [Diplocarpon coronariae]|nr:integral membrane protein [Diplocarpon mali]
MIRPRHEHIPGDSRVTEILAGVSAPQALATLFIVGRIFARTCVLKIWNWDDTLIIIAWLHSFAMTALFGVSTYFGQGHHMQNIPPKLLSTSFSLTCNPLSGGNFYGSKFCFKSRKVIVASTVCHTVTDAWMIVMIIPVVRSLRIPSRQKWTLMGIMSLGVFVIAASITRMVSISRYHQNTPDPSWVIVEFYIWTAVESSVGIVCACAPTLRPVLSKMFPTFVAGYSAGSAKSGRHGRRTTVERRMSGAIELGSGDPPLAFFNHTTSPEGPWKEMHPAESLGPESAYTQHPLRSHTYIHPKLSGLHKTPQEDREPGEAM